MRYKAVIFDLDGTILNTLEDLADSTNYALQENHMPERTMDEVRAFVGNGIHRLIERAVPEKTGAEDIENVFTSFHHHYSEHCADKTRPYDGITDVLQTLQEKNVMTAVVSNKADYAVKELCGQYFPGLFRYSVGDREGQRRKPAPDSVNAVLSQFDIDRSEAVYIGDSEVDIQTAANAGMDVIMVGWGFREEAYLKQMGAPFVIGRPEEILEHMENVSETRTAKH